MLQLTSRPETRFMPKKLDTHADAPMANPAIDSSSSSLAMRLRSLSRVSSSTPCVVSMFVASCSTRSVSACDSRWGGQGQRKYRQQAKVRGRGSIGSSAWLSGWGSRVG